MTSDNAVWASAPWRALVQEAFDAFDAPLHVALGFVDPPVDPPMAQGIARLELVVALPAMRLAGLRPWRDDVEVWSPCGDRQLVVWEALRWAQWWRRGEPRVIALMGRTATIEDAEAWLVAVRHNAVKCPEFHTLGPSGPSRWSSSSS